MLILTKNVSRQRFFFFGNRYLNFNLQEILRLIFKSTLTRLNETLQGTKKNVDHC